MSGYGEKQPSYSEIKTQLINLAKTATEDIRILARTEVGTPAFDAIPEQIAAVPAGLNIKILLVIPDDGLLEDNPTHEIFLSIREARRARIVAGNGPIFIKIIRENDVPSTLPHSGVFI